MIAFEEAKKGYDKAQVEEYFQLVKEKYETLFKQYNELFEAYNDLAKKYQSLSRQYSQQQETIEKLQSETYYSDLIHQEKMQDIAMALIDAQAQARQIVNSARDKAWQILTDAQRGAPAPSLSIAPAGSAQEGDAVEEAAPDPAPDSIWQEEFASIERLLDSLRSL